MEKTKLSKEKAEEILNELKCYKERKNVKIRFATDKSTEDIVGNVSACTDCDDDSGTGGGVGDDSACSGSPSACTDCDDDSGTGGGVGDDSACSGSPSACTDYGDDDISGNYSACTDSVC